MPKSEITALTPAQEVAFQQWIKANGIQDLNEPDSHYDYRGFWLKTQGQPHPPGKVQHFPDTFKQHGHPSFSQQSQYSAGPADGGMWVGPEGPDQQYLAQPRMAVSHPTFEQALLELARRGGQ